MHPIPGFRVDGRARGGRPALALPVLWDDDDPHERRKDEEADPRGDGASGGGEEREGPGGARRPKAPRRPSRRHDVWI